MLSVFEDRVSAVHTRFTLEIRAEQRDRIRPVSNMLVFSNNSGLLPDFQNKLVKISGEWWGYWWGLSTSK
jgi:hypothetical protein